MATRYWHENMLPFAAMVSVESAIVSANTLFKAASSKGLSFYVFIFYTNLITTLILLPVPFFLCRSTRGYYPLIQFSVLSRIFIIAIILTITQITCFKGIAYSSPTLSSAMSNLTLPFTFLLAVILRMERLSLKSSSTQAKIIGTIVSISGALMVVLYKGPVIKLTSSAALFFSSHPSMYNSPQSYWIIGGVLFVIQYFLNSVRYIFQAQVMEIYPSELQVTFFVGLCLTLISAPVCFISEPNWSAWRLCPDIELAAIAYNGLFATPFMAVVMLWCMKVKGPVYVASFKPLSIAIAAVLSAIFLGDALHLGSVIGAIIISVGFYAIIWGKTKEKEIIKGSRSDNLGSSFNGNNTPLLQSHKVEVA